MDDNTSKPDPERDLDNLARWIVAGLRVYLDAPDIDRATIRAHLPTFLAAVSHGENVRAEQARAAKLTRLTDEGTADLARRLRDLSIRAPYVLIPGEAEEIVDRMKDMADEDEQQAAAEERAAALETDEGLPLP
jgi:hypothetical protein